MRYSKSSKRERIQNPAREKDAVLKIQQQRTLTLKLSPNLRALRERESEREEGRKEGRCVVVVGVRGVWRGGGGGKGEKK